jgi:N-acetylglucosaminyldiphosphoundecaprenol N-acetyl-beta-D-mannosaminyltransferase
MYKNINFLDINVAALDLDGIIREITEYALSGKRNFITYINAHCANISFVDIEYRETLRKANLVYAGGQGVVWATRFLRSPLPGRINILDFFDKLTVGLKRRGITIYLLGGQEDIVKKTEASLREKGLDVVGYRSGFFDDPQEQELIREINMLKPDILMVGMGVPKQEKWIYRHLDELDVRLCWAVGAAFDWLSGRRKRAPRWMVQLGLEWVHRLFQQPRRLWKRYLIGNIIFVYHILSYKIKG